SIAAEPQAQLGTEDDFERASPQMKKGADGDVELASGRLGSRRRVLDVHQVERELAVEGEPLSDPPAEQRSGDESDAEVLAALTSVRLATEVRKGQKGPARARGRGDDGRRVARLSKRRYLQRQQD